jgi:hypothetical protein
MGMEFEKEVHLERDWLKKNTSMACAAMCSHVRLFSHLIRTIGLRVCWVDEDN